MSFLNWAGPAYISELGTPKVEQHSVIAMAAFAASVLGI